MQPPRVASAAWVFAATPSKVWFYAAGALLAGWAVLLAVTGITHHEFPSSPVRARLVMLTSATLVAATVTSAVVTGSGPAEEREHAAPAPAPTSRTLALTADPAGALAYNTTHAAVKAGKVEIRFTSRSPIPHNVTIAKDSQVLAATKTITGATTDRSVDLQPGNYVFYCSVDQHRQAGMQGTLTVG